MLEECLGVPDIVEKSGDWTESGPTDWGTLRSTQEYQTKW